MADEIRARSYLLTGNNPENLIDELTIDHESATEADYRESLETLRSIWVSGDERHEDRKPDINGFMAVWERGETGTNHVHIWICCKNPISEKVIKSRFPGFHIDVVKAKDSAEVERYMTKSDKHEGKKETQLCEAIEWGDYFCTNAGTASKIYQDLEKYVKQGMKPSQIILSDPRFAMHEQMVNAYYGAYAQSKIKPLRDVRVIYRTGEVGAGKSYTYVRLCEQYGEENVYLFNGASTTHGCFDEYESQRILVLDEIRADTFKLPELLTLLDGYKRRLPARYKNKYAAWEEVHITTVIPPESLFQGMKKGGAADTFEQLKRRLDTVVYHYKDERYSGQDIYRTVEIKATDYRDVAQLQGIVRQRKDTPTGQSTLDA